MHWFTGYSGNILQGKKPRLSCSTVPYKLNLVSLSLYSKSCWYSLGVYSSCNYLLDQLCSQCFGQHFGIFPLHIVVVFKALSIVLPVQLTQSILASIEFGCFGLHFVLHSMLLSCSASVHSPVCAFCLGLSFIPKPEHYYGHASMVLSLHGIDVPLTTQP